MGLIQYLPPLVVALLMLYVIFEALRPKVRDEKWWAEYEKELHLKKQGYDRGEL